MSGFRPLFLILELGLLALAHYLYKRLTQEGNDRIWTGRQYIKTLCALLIYSYTAAADSVFLYLGCVPIGKHTVVAGLPALDCKSDEYKTLLPLVYTVLVLYIAVGPVL